MKKYKAIVPVKDLLDTNKLHVNVNDMAILTDYGGWRQNVKLLSLPDENNLVYIMSDTGVSEQIHVDRLSVEIDAVLVYDIVSIFSGL